MELINTMLQGIGAIADILSITRDTGAQLDSETHRSEAARRTQTPPAASPTSPESDAERVEREHREEMNAIRKAQEAAVQHRQDGPNLKR